MTEISQKGCALITGAGGRLGPLLRAARDANAAMTNGFLFQSRRPGFDVQWSPGSPTHALPRCTALVALWGATTGTAQDLALNAQLVETSAELALEIGAKKVIHLSTAGVYGPGIAMSEDHPVGQTGPYGQAKIAMEKAVAARRGQDGLSHLCLRLANVVGADSLEPALSGRTSARVDQFADGRGPMRSYIGASDLLMVIDALLAFPADAWPEVLNVAAPKPVAMEALLEAANRAVTWVPAPSSAIQTVTLDVSRMQALLPHLIFRNSAEDHIADWQCLIPHS